MSKGGIAVLVVAALVFAALGFVFGQVVQAAVNNPGPLVSESWVEQYVGQKLADMQLKIDELEAQLLQYQTGGVASGSPSIPEPGGQTGSGVTTPPAQATPTTVKVKSNSVNVRSDATVDASIVGSVAAETTLTYLDKKVDSKNQTWYKVRLANGTEGWVAGWLCYDPQ